MRCRHGKKRSRTFLFHCLYLPPKPSGRGEATPWRKTLDAVHKWTDGLLMSLPTRCMPVLMLDLNDRLGRRPRAEEPHDLIGTVGAGVEGDSATRFRALVRRHSIAVPQTFHLATHIFYGSSGRSRIDFVATLPFVQFSRIFVNVTTGRRLQLIPAAGPRDNMPLTMDLVTNGMRHSLDPRVEGGITRKSKKCSRIPLTFFKELETKIRNSSIVGLAATEATPDDAWENLVQII